MSLRADVEALVARIPTGMLMTYGQIAVLCGSPRAARLVGGIAHYGDPGLPWHRVVNRRGRLASGYPGGRCSQAKRLAQEGLIIRDDCVEDFKSHLWNPSREGRNEQG